ncbi:MAG: hypothetical protein P1U68_02880 [Verrucomicrobiales bacterium]|nr:hypothetical protein [Verrucomicrobiales bacterium]
MKYIPTVARYLLGLIFVVFAANMWLKFIPVPPPEEGSLAAGFMGAIYMSGFLTVVKVLELLGGILLLSGRFVNLALAVLGPIVVVIGLYHFLLVKGGYPMAIVLGLLALAALSGRRGFVKELLAQK